MEGRKMRQLIVKPQIHAFDKFGAFAEEFGLGGDDLIFTEAFLHDTFISKLGLECKVLLRDEFGMGEPDDEMIDGIAEKAKDFGCRRIVAVGGGSVIDIAKILVLKSAPTRSLFAKETASVKEKELIIVPTTCGTGSEMTNLSIVHIVSKGTKMGLGDDALFADHAVMIPALVEGLPQKFFVFSAIDALVHASESYISPKANAFTETFSLAACEMILNGFTQMIEQGESAKKDLAGAFLTASCMAGIAFGNAGVGSVHALAYPLGGNYHVPHGEANCQFFSEVFNLYFTERPTEKLTALASTVEKSLKRLGIEYDTPFDGLFDMLLKLQPIKRLREYGMKQEEIELFSQSVIDNQQRLLVNSHIPFTIQHARKIYGNRY